MSVELYACMWYTEADKVYVLVEKMNLIGKSRKRTAAEKRNRRSNFQGKDGFAVEQNKNNVRPPLTLDFAGVLLRTALILLCLVLLSVHLMGSLFGKYSSTAEGSASASVAVFDVKVTGDPTDISVQCTQVPEDAATYQITVKNDSEVAVKYDVIVTLSKIVDGVCYKLDDTVAVTAMTTTYSNVGQLSPNDPNTHIHTLTFLVDWDKFTADTFDVSCFDNFTFDITVHIEQVN
ncbi:MAG: hypothetical protein IKY59_02805 [Oscillospiraceae bacterium]|nr:hypothetical protein [Oscillospiraceae bacterium]